MLDVIRTWLIGVTCAALVAALAEGLTPDGTVRKIGRLASGLVLLAAMLQPLLRLNTTALTQALTEYKLDLSAYSTDLEEENQELMKGIIEEQAGAYILDKATALGITCQVRVEAQEEEEWPIPHSVFISGVLTQEQQQALTQVIEREFAIPAARQYYESGADEA
ncbi:stage III sporulation protein AF [Flavonifractor hominis]|uniref:Stage III sporulation protein AF n=1 Tax=Flavonifractor hominis TaxID=3133178 RepID=A0ABV1EKG7_9FIRM